MRSIVYSFCACLAIAASSLLAADSSQPSRTTPEIEWIPSPLTLHRWRVLPMLLREANDVAAGLHLSGKLPVTEKEIEEGFVPPPDVARDHEALGTVSTSNYLYCVSRGNKFSYLIGIHQKEDCFNWEK